MIQSLNQAITMRRRDFLASMAAATAALRLYGQQALPYGAPGVTVQARPRDYSEDLARYLTRLMDERRGQRRKALAAVTTRAQAERRIAEIRAKVWELMGGPLEKTPLNPRITGSIPRDGYRIDKLIYESRPKLFVTSNLYVPEGRGPFPAVLSSLGHSGNGKAFTSYQALFHSLARKGYMVLAYDPFGQGERIEHPGPAPGRSALGGPTREHDYAGKRLLLLGPNFSLFRAWDGIRGLDYLLSRDDVDPARVGCGGQSGGGTMTMYLAAIDERIRVAIVAEGNTENVAQPGFEPPGAVDDAEQNLVPSLVYGLDRFDLLHAVAPRPLMVNISNKDAGTTYGPEYVREGLALLEELKKTYGLLGAAERVTLVETPMPHNYGYEDRRASYAWYNRWIGAPESGSPRRDDAEAPVTPEPEERLWCTKTGSVAALEGESSFTLTRTLAQATRPAGPVTAQVIRNVLGIGEVGVPACPPSGASVPPGVAAARNRPECPSPVSTTEKHDHAIEEIDIPSEGEIHVPCWVVRGLGSRPRQPAVLALADGGKDSFIGDDGTGAEAARLGYVFCAVDLRGRGQCTPRPPQHGPRYYGGRGEDYYIWDTLMLGRPMLGGYVRDALAACAYLRSRADVDPARCWIVGQGTMGVVALLALALEPAARGGIVQTALTDYRSVVENDQYNTPFRIFAPGILKHFDLPDVARLVAPRPLLLVNPVTQDGRNALEVSGARVAALYPQATVRAVERVTPRVWVSWFEESARV
jgi:cephalosporin-C deacetylase-like acetyl esterase